MSLIENFASLLNTNFEIFVIIGTMIFGNPFLIFTAILSAQRIFSLWKLVFYGYVGIIISDLIWFYLGRNRLIKNLGKKKTRKKFKNLRNTLSETFHKNNFLVIFMSKFFYGTRTITVLYAGRKKMSLPKFILYDFPSAFIWGIFMIGLGYLTGKGFTKFLDFFNDVRVWLTFLLVITIALYLIWMALIRTIFNFIKNKKD